MIVRVYKNKSQSKAVMQAVEEAERDNLVIVSQSWQDGRGGCLRVILLGIFALIFKPAGELTVTLKPAK